MYLEKLLSVYLLLLHFHRNMMFVANENFLLSLWILVNVNEYICFFSILVNSDFKLNISSRSQMFFKIGFLKNLRIFTGKHLYQSLILNEVVGLRAYNFILKKTPTQVFPCECCGIFTAFFLVRIWTLFHTVFKNSFSNRTPPVAAFS